MFDIDSIHKIVSTLNASQLDTRSKKGRRYEFPPLFKSLLLGKICSCNYIKSIYLLIKDLPPSLISKLGFHGDVPCYETFLRLANSICPDSFNLLLNNYYDLLFEKERRKKRLSNRYHYSLDGKALNGTKTDSGCSLHQISFFDNENNMVVYQHKSKSGGGEITATVQALKKIDIEGSLITGDATFANEKVRKKIVKKKGNYILTLKSNNQTLWHDMQQVFRLNPFPELITSYDTGYEKGHGRLEKRSIEVISTSLLPHLEKLYPTIKQVARITRERLVLNKLPLNKSEEPPVEVCYVIISFEKKDITAKEILHYNREHWAIENILHRTRDVFFNEDNHIIKNHNTAQNSSTLNNLTIFIISLAKKISKKIRNYSTENIRRYFACNIRKAMELLRLVPT